MRTLLLAIIAALFAQPATAKTVRAGIEAWQKGDAAAAVAIWRPLADKGDADAAFNLGQAYRLGKGVPIDLAQAQSWLERAARKGHLDAGATLGLLLFQNGNRVTAMRWLRAAAEAGEPRALLMVGTALYNGDGVPSDPVTAYAYISRAAAQGLAPAKATLADMDEIMPLEQRRKGLELAKKMVATVSAQRQQAAPSAKASTPKTAAAKPVPAKPVPPKPAVESAPTIKSTPAKGNWRVQLGAFGQRSSAEALYARMSSKLGGRPAHYVPAGKVVRLQVGPFDSRAAAAAACATVAPQACFPVESR